MNLRRNLLPSQTLYSLVVLLASLGLIAFGSTSRRQQAVPAARTRLTVHMQHLFDGVPLHLNGLRLTNQMGNTLSVSRLAYLLSAITLRRADGTTVHLADQVAYLNPAEKRDTFVLDNIPADTYTGLSFRVGLEPETNHSDPAQYAPGHPLNPLTNKLHWGWQGGYVFLALEGRWVRPDGKPGGYSYHLATDRNPMIVSLSQPLPLDRNRALMLQFDVARVFDAVHLITIRHERGGDSTHSAPGDLLAVLLKENVARAFRIGSVAPDESTLNAAPSAQSTSAHSATMPPPYTTAYTLAIPAHFPQPTLPADNPLTVEGIALGKRLFFEKRLSGNNTQSCASCHQPQHAFADGDKAVSVGIDGKKGSRNAMPLFNLAWSSSYTWDGRRTRLRDQALAPIQDGKEMHQSLTNIVIKLQITSIYPPLFHRAFGSSSITAERIGLAVEQYLLTLISADSKFDRALRGEAQFTHEEKQGLMLFITEYDPARGKIGADCFHCHGGNLFTDYQYKNNGLDDRFRDEGRFRATGLDSDRGKFKTPSLRNVALTAPYMHDGRFKTLEQVVAHYNSGVHRSATLDPNLAKHPDAGLRLSQSDQKALVAFLKTLTDERFLKHPSGS